MKNKRRSTMYYYKNISDEDKALILEGIRVLNDLNVPISEEAIFVYCHGSSRFGWCGKDKEYKFRIAINEDIKNDEKKINTIIHELLHTIPNETYTMHGGNWKKYADYVSNNTNFKITVSDKYLKIDYKPKKIISFEKCICPICNKIFDIKSSKIHGNVSDYRCKKCNKILYKTIPDSPLKEMTINERQYYIESKLCGVILKSDIYDYLIFSNKEDTRNLIRYFFKKYGFFSTDINKLYGYIDKTLKEELCFEFLDGKWDCYINSEEERLNFESIFALTDWWTTITERSNSVFGPLGEGKYDSKLN